MWTILDDKMIFLYLSLWFYVSSVVVLCQPINDNNLNDKNVEEFKKEQQAWIASLPPEQQGAAAKVNGDWYGWGVKKETDLEKARQVELLVQPRTMIDDIEDCFVERYNKEFKKNESFVKSEHRKINNHIRDLVGRINNIDNKLNASAHLNLKDEEINNYYEQRRNFRHLIEDREKEKEIVERKYLGNYQYHEDRKQRTIANRDHRLHWILKTQTDIEGKIKRINYWIEKRYREKCEEKINFKETTTLDDFTQIFTLSLSKAHDQGSRIVVHATRKLAIPDDCEFERIPFFGNDLDEYLTILVNAVGTCSPTSKAAITFKTRKTTPWKIISTKGMTPQPSTKE